MPASTSVSAEVTVRGSRCERGPSTARPCCAGSWRPKNRDPFPTQICRPEWVRRRVKGSGPPPQLFSRAIKPICRCIQRLRGVTRTISPPIFRKSTPARRGRSGEVAQPPAPAWPGREPNGGLDRPAKCDGTGWAPPGGGGHVRAAGTAGRPPIRRPRSRGDVPTRRPSTVPGSRTGRMTSW